MTTGCVSGDVQRNVVPYAPVVLSIGPQVSPRKFQSTCLPLNESRPSSVTLCICFVAPWLRGYNNTHHHTSRDPPPADALARGYPLHAKLHRVLFRVAVRTSSAPPRFAWRKMQDRTTETIKKNLALYFHTTHAGHRVVSARAMW